MSPGQLLWKTGDLSPVFPKTASVVTDSAGNIKSESDYYPWGGEVQMVNNDPNHYKFTGKERDSESGLDYFGARYYSNGLGRFITPDWAAKATAVPYAEFGDPQSLNLYSYVRNVPTTRFDIDGHQDADPAYKKFTKALGNIVSVKTEVGTGYKISASLGGAKVSAGSGVSTETKSYPLGDHPTEVTSKAESKLEVKVGPVSGEVTNKAPGFNPETGKIDKGGSGAKVGAGGEHVTGVSIDTDHEVSVIGVTAKAGPVGGGAEVVINTDQLKDAVKNFLPAIGDGIKTLTGFGSDNGSMPHNPFPGLQNPIPN